MTTNIAKYVFTDIFDRGMWSYEETRDGDYANVSHTHHLIRELIPFLKKWNFKSIFDASCGEHCWSRTVDFAGNDIQYIGGEIVEAKITKLEMEFPKKDFRVFDIIEDKFPDVDVWMCKDTLIHFPLHYTQKTFRNFLRSNIDYCLITSITIPRQGYNEDILEFGPPNYGPCVQTNWNRPPFDFPEPMDIIEYTHHEKLPPKSNGTERDIDIGGQARFFLFLYHRDQIKDLPFITGKDWPVPAAYKSLLPSTSDIPE